MDGWRVRKLFVARVGNVCPPLFLRRYTSPRNKGYIRLYPYVSHSMRRSRSGKGKFTRHDLRTALSDYGQRYCDPPPPRNWPLAAIPNIRNYFGWILPKMCFRLTVPGNDSIGMSSA